MRLLKKSKLLIFLISLIIMIGTVHAASMAGNDGSAFITKAEFDSLKNNFQSQIDSYNTSIDSKIDTAIASYLSGVKIARTTDENQLCYDASGILSPRAGYKDLNFKEGYLNWNFIWTAMSYLSGFKLKLNGKDGTDEKYYFKEMGINDIYNNGSKYIASWTGYVKDKQYLLQSANHFTGAEYWPQIVETQKIQVNYLGFPQISNYRFNTENSTQNMMIVSIGGYKTEPWGSWSFNAFHHTASRTVYSTTNQNIIITPKSVSCKRFSRLDDVYDFKNCVDPDTTTFRALVDSDECSLDVVFDSITMLYCAGADSTTTYTRYENKPGAFKKGFSLGNKHKYYGETSAGVKPSNWATVYGWEPYLGFCNYYTDYNQLYTKLYDSYIEDMKSKHADLNVMKDSKGVEHLALNAGSPIVSVGKGDEVTFDINFADTGKNYDVWLKIGSFSYSKEPTAENNLIGINNIKVNNADATSGSASKSFRINNGKGKVVANIPSDGYLFIKWQYADTNVVGGGTYMPTKTVTVKLAEE